MKRFPHKRVIRLSRELMVIALGQALAVIGSLLGLRVLTGLLEPEAYGQLALGMTVSTLIYSVIFGPLSNGATRFYSAAREADTLRMFLISVRNLAIILTGIILALMVIFVLTATFTGNYGLIGIGIASLMFALLHSYNSVISGIQNAARHRSVVALHQGMAAWGRFFIAAGLIMIFGPKGVVAMCGYVFAMIIVLASQSFFFRRIYQSAKVVDSLSPMTHKEWQSKIFHYSWPFATWGFMGWMYLVSDRWAIQGFLSTKDVGIYAVLFQVGYYPIYILSGLINNLLAPIYFEHAGDATDHTRVSKVYSISFKFVLFSLVLTLTVFVLTIFFHKHIFSFLVAKEYTKVSYLLPWMVLASGLYATTHFSAIFLHVQKSTKYLIVPKNVLNIIGVLMIVVSVLLYGLVGVVVVKIIYGVISLTWIMLIARKQHRKLFNG